MFDLTEYFSDTVEGTGIFRDRFGKVRLAFDVTMSGSWRDNTYRLEENFRYDDGRIQDRLWKIRRNGDRGLSATADDLVGTAMAEQLEDEVRWTYRMRVPVGSREITMTFDDRMYLRPDGVLLNVSEARKFGIVVGRLTAVYRRDLVARRISGK